MNHPTRWMSPREKLVARLALVAALGVVAACASGPERSIPNLFDGYERSPAFDEAVQPHVDAGADKDQRMLLTTWFQDGDPRVAQFCSVRPDGRCSTYQYVHQTEFRAPSTRQLTPDVLRTIEAAFADLPASQKPPLANLLILSYRLNGQWQTRLYDRMNRPPAVSTVVETAGAPIVP